MSDNSSLVHNIETSGTRTHLGYREYAVRYKKGEVQLSKLLYKAIDNERRTTYSDSYNACRTRAWFVHNDESHIVRVRSNHCGLRWCPLCSASKSWIYSQQMIPWLGKCKHAKFVTLTLKHSELALSVQLDRIYKSFQSLKKKANFKKYIIGGVWFFQVVKSHKTQQWHPHLHILVDGRYMPQRILRQMWEKITGDSYIVHIEAVKNKQKALEYAARYVARPMSLRGLNNEEFCELFEAFHGRRLCGVFGTARGISFNPDKLPSSGNWVKIGSFDVVMRFKDYDQDATDIYSAWKTGEPLENPCDFSYADLFINSGGDYDPYHITRAKEKANPPPVPEPCLWD